MTEISNGYFPDYDVQWDYSLTRKFSTTVVTSKTGKEQRKRNFPGNGVTGTGHKGGYLYISASSDAFTPTERQVVADFLESMEGSYRAFYFWRRDRDNFSNFEMGSVVAATSIVIPFRQVSLTSVTLSNVAVIGATITENVGAGGEARINFPSGSGVIRATLRARQRVLVRAVNDDIVTTFIENVMNDNAVFPLAFKQVR